MYELIKSVLKPLVDPATLFGFIFLGFCLVYLAKAGKTKFKAGMVLLVFLYFFFGSLPVNNFLIGLLEIEANKMSQDVRPGDVDLIVVLAAETDEAGGVRLIDELSQNQWKRLWRGIELFDRLEGKVPILYSGQSMNGKVNDEIEEAPIRAVFKRCHIPDHKIWMETVSGDTHESALEVKKLLISRDIDPGRFRLVVVTSAAHIPRAVKTFRKEGMNVIAAPCDYSSEPWDMPWYDYLPNSSAFRIGCSALYEWVGHVIYRLRGWI
ncbi:MAG: YdcF family protein [Candidatus Omnitrophica bacterium]|nr:YdcF family protein [Candidatus Omnitrophota bacterium]